MSTDVPPEALDALDDLGHDLGRHIRLPLALLPVDASAEAVREALDRALRRTRTGPTGTFSAAALLAEFVARVPADLHDELTPLARAVSHAESLLDVSMAATPAPREEIRRRLEAVAEAIAAVRVRWQARGSDPR